MLRVSPKWLWPSLVVGACSLNPQPDLPLEGAGAQGGTKNSGSAGQTSGGTSIQGDAGENAAGGFDSAPAGMSGEAGQGGAAAGQGGEAGANPGEAGAGGDTVGDVAGGAGGQR